MPEEPENEVCRPGRRGMEFIKRIKIRAKNEKTGWIDNADSYICPICGFETGSLSRYKECACPKCGFKPKRRKKDIEKIAKETIDRMLEEENGLSRDYVYFILYDEVETNSKNGWCVSEKHKIIDRCKRGFFTGSEKDFPNIAEFTPWADLGLQAFYSEEKAREMCEKLAEMGLGFWDGFEYLVKEREKKWER